MRRSTGWVNVTTYKTTTSGNPTALLANAVWMWFANTVGLTRDFAQLKVNTSRSRVDGVILSSEAASILPPALVVVPDAAMSTDVDLAIEWVCCPFHYLFAGNIWQGCLPLLD